MSSDLPTRAQAQGALMMRGGTDRAIHGRALLVAYAEGRLVDICDRVLYEHDGESRTSDGNHLTARECEMHAIEWGMVRVSVKGNEQ